MKMKKIVFCLATLAVSALVAFAGESYSGKEVRQVAPPPCPEWYGDNEWNVSLWGNYVFTSENWENDEYIEADHAWGGGMDLKYFFHRYFGVGVEGWVVNAERQTFDGSGVGTPVLTFSDDERLVGAVLGTLTVRFPLHCSRIAPYVYGGAGAIFGGGERDELVLAGLAAPTYTTIHHDSEPEFVGQIGAGFEVRLTRHLSFINDFNYNFVAKDNSDFGMVRAGLNFAF
jgi:hypothetical protein